ncbi:F-box protein [Aspergillus lucknowensis]|uniref:F-box domain-containing protein n=1 Tax=Aspergillus lucknowensis TaxID=176173 RepID=A0ABR4M476_9EURO
MVQSYCNICGGPLASLDESDSDDPEAKLHEQFCARRRAYSSTLLSEEHLRWLNSVRMLRVKDPENPENNSRVWKEGGGGAYLTHVGAYHDLGGLRVRGGGPDRLHPNEDGFLAHAACWDMLYLVYQTTGFLRSPLSLTRLFLVMQSNLGGESFQVINWGNLYYNSALAACQDDEWLSLPNLEYVVSNPEGQMDFWQLFMKAALAAALNRITTAGAGAGAAARATRTPQFDPFFSRLPTEILHMILNLLPAKSVINLFVASPIFRVVSMNLPNTFWKSRIDLIPWIKGTGFHEALAQFTGGGGLYLDYKKLFTGLQHYVDFDQYLSDLGNMKTWPEANRNLLMNRRRIWRCCETILERMGAKVGSDGLMFAELRSKANIRLVSIQPWPIPDWETYDYDRLRGDCVNMSDIYFVSLLQGKGGALTAHFNKEGSIVGIEYEEEGKRNTDQLLGDRTDSTHPGIIPPNVHIDGIILSLGPHGGTRTENDSKSRTIRGLRVIFTADSATDSITLGRFASIDVVHVFRPGPFQPGTVVGIAGHSTDVGIATFGLITVPGRASWQAPVKYNTDIYSRWLGPELPPVSLNANPRSVPIILHRVGINGFPSKKRYPFRPPLLENPAVYVDLATKQLVSIRAFFPLGTRQEIGGLLFYFAGSTPQLVGKDLNHEDVKDMEARCGEYNTVAFDVAGGEKITKVRCWFGDLSERSTPTKLHRLRFYTSSGRELDLGLPDAERTDDGTVMGPIMGYCIVGLHFGIKDPVIESIGLAIADSSAV